METSRDPINIIFLKLNSFFPLFMWETCFRRVNSLVPLKSRAPLPPPVPLKAASLVTAVAAAEKRLGKILSRTFVYEHT